MNFIHSFETGKCAVEVELKYCERCGGLWLRRRGLTDVDCGACRAQLAAYEGACRVRGGPGRKEPNAAQIDCLLGVVEMEVRV